MKRAEELKDLSRDHHHALVLGRKCVRAADADGSTAQLEVTWAAAAAAFARELEPHFGVEEMHLLTAMAAAGEADLVARTRRDHARLRELVRLPAERGVLREFGELLGAHVRFEEQELFPRAEQVLSAADLATIAHAGAALATAQQRARR